MERPGTMPRFRAASLTATTSGRWLALATTAGVSRVAPRAKTASGRSGKLRQVQSMPAPRVRPRHPPYFIGARQRTIPDSRLWAADRIVAMEARRAVRRQAFGLRRQPERARRALVRRVRRRSCNIEQQWRGQGAAAALEYVDGEACSRERKSDAQRRG